MSPKETRAALGWDSRSHDKGTETFSSVDYRVEDEHSSSATITASSLFLNGYFAEALPCPRLRSTT